MVAPAKVLVVELDKGMTQGCKRCRRIFPEYSGGKFAVGLIVEEKDGEYRYFIGNDDLVECCGEEKLFVATFTDEQSAERKKSQVLTHLKKHKTTGGLNLRAFAFNVPKTDQN